MNALKPDTDSFSFPHDVVSSTLAVECCTEIHISNGFRCQNRPIYMYEKQVVLYFCICLKNIKIIRVIEEKKRKFSKWNKQVTGNRSFYNVLSLRNPFNFNPKERITRIKECYYTI